MIPSQPIISGYCGQVMLVVPAHAKINLALDVVGRRLDGFHDIMTVLVPVDWHDLVGVRVTTATQPVISLRLSGSTATVQGVPTGEANLAHRAAAAWQRLTPRPLRIDVWLHKRIPSAAGLGGGSADAAAVLRAGALQLSHLDPGAVQAVAAEIGSDVPALLAGGSRLVTGRGERLLSLPAPAPPIHLVVAVAGASVTAVTYAALTDAECRDSGRSARVAAALTSGRHPALDDLGSILEPAACRADPDLCAAIEAMRASIPEARWHLTGSGGALFTLVPTAAAARTLADRTVALGLPARACVTCS